MAKYSEKAQDMVEDAMHRMKKGTLKSGSGKKVTDKKQAVAIGLSEARDKGAKVPKKSESSSKASGNKAGGKSSGKGSSKS